MAGGSRAEQAPTPHDLPDPLLHYNPHCKCITNMYSLTHKQCIPDVEEKVQALLNGGQNMVKSYVVSGLPFPLSLSYWECGEGEGVWGVGLRVGRRNRGGWGRERIGHSHCSHWIPLHLRHTLDKEGERRKAHTHTHTHKHEVMPTTLP